MFQICLIVYLSSLFTSTHELQSAYCQTPSATGRRPPRGPALNSRSGLYCVVAEGSVTSDGENEKNDWTVSAEFFHVFTLKHQIKEKKVLTTCVVFDKLHNCPADSSEPHNRLIKAATGSF